YWVDRRAELLAEAGASARLAWLVGADSLLPLDTWHRWRDVFGLAHVVAVQRPGAEVDAARLRAEAPAVLDEIDQRWLPPQALAGSPCGGFALLPLPELRPESSTELRRRIAAGEPWRDWVPPAVAAHIDRHGLYRDPPAILAPFPSSDRP